MDIEIARKHFLFKSALQSSKTRLPRRIFRMRQWRCCCHISGNRETWVSVNCPTTLRHEQGGKQGVNHPAISSPDLFPLSLIALSKVHTSQDTLCLTKTIEQVSTLKGKVTERATNTGVITKLWSQSDPVYRETLCRCVCHYTGECWAQRNLLLAGRLREGLKTETADVALRSKTSPCGLLGMCSLPRASEELPLFAYESCDMLFTSHSLISVYLKPEEGGGYVYCLYNLWTLSGSCKSKVHYTVCVWALVRNHIRPWGGIWEV